MTRVEAKRLQSSENMCNDKRALIKASRALQKVTVASGDVYIWEIEVGR